MHKVDMGKIALVPAADMDLELSVIKDLYTEDRSFKRKRTVVPWYNPEQFQKVHEYLYSSDIMKKRWAVDQMDVWESRCHPSLPTGIEASQTIAKAVIQDILYTNQANICQEKEIQLMYSMALVRFVNLTIELHQSYAKQPLTDVAERLGIPSWIIDLRNESAHSYIPSLPLLRKGAEEAMTFLNKSYWSVESRKLKSVVKEPMALEKVRSLLAGFQFYQSSYVLGRKSKKFNSTPENLIYILRKIDQCVHENRKEFIEVMCMDGVFITSTSDFKLFLTDEGAAKMCEFEEDQSDYPPVLPSSVERFWCPILKIVNKFNAIPELVEALLYVQGDKGLCEQKLLASWIARILRFPQTAMDKHSSPLMKHFQIKPPLFNWNRLMYAAIANPCKYTPYIFPLINVHLDLDKEFLRPVMCLMAISLGQAIEKDVSLKDQPAFTVEHVKKEKKLLERNMKKSRRKVTANKWSYAPDNIDWSNIPIGHVFTSYAANAGNLSDDDWMDTVDDKVYTDKYLGNKNDSEDMKGFDTVEQDTFEKDVRIILDRKKFLIMSK